MASLAVAAPNGGRISQILPSVKCSNCNQPVPIADLGDHVCEAPPPMPAASANPPMSPTATSFFQQKYQKLIAGNRGPPTPAPTQPVPPTPVQPPPRAPSTGPLQRGKSPGPPSAPPPQSALPATPPTSQRRPSRAPSPLARTGSPGNSPKVAFPSKLETPELPRAGSTAPRIPSPLSSRASAAVSIASSRTSSGTMRVTSPDITSPVRSPPLRNQPTPVRQPAQSSPAPFSSGAPMPVRSPPPRDQRTPVSGSQMRPDMYVRPPAQSSPAPFVPPQSMASPPGGMNGPPRARAASNASMALGSDVIYSTGRPNMPPPSRGPPLSVNVNAGPSGIDRYAQPSGTPMGGGATSPLERPVEPDTKIGGEAGMAGVGRRGFAAAARAAMFANTMGGYNSPQSEHPLFQPPQAPSMDGRRAHAPRYLDIASANQYNPLGTPPLSPGSTVSPRSPHSQHSPLSATTPPLLQETRNSVTPTQPVIARTPSPSDRSYVGRDRVVPPAPEPPKQPIPATPTTPSLPFFEKFKNKISPVDTNPPVPDSAEPSPLSPPTNDDDDDSDFEGLAYADGSDDEGTEVPPDRVRFPSMSAKTTSFAAKSESKYSSSSSTATPSPRIPMMRSLSQSTATSAYTVRTTAKSTGALDRAMETLLEEDATSPTASSVSSPAMFPVGLAQDGSRDRDSMRPKLPTRSHTSPSARTSKLEAKRRPPKVRACLKCGTNIEDERWIRTEGGGVMCDRCWKNMYLPKCRRCNLAIEKHAVSSSDGQLKGKYHRDCFNCHTCHKPFPDKTFYVWDGKPFCAYHYHEANKSLCAAPSCGEPIEGPCAVSHSGERYHPEHFTCEHPRCSERLVEYWEADGKLYCDRHARGMELDMDEDDDEDRPLALRPRRQSVRDSLTHATKRKTVFLNLGSNGMF